MVGHFIVYATPDFLDKARRKKTYGNLGNKRVSTLWSIARDIMMIQPKARIFFYETEKKRLHGVYQATSAPFFCYDNLFAESSSDAGTDNDTDTDEKFPFRFKFEELRKFDEPVPADELVYLVDRKLLTSIITFDKDPTSPFRSVVKITRQEAVEIVRALHKYNLDAEYSACAHSPDVYRPTYDVEVADIIPQLADPQGRANLPSNDRHLKLDKLPDPEQQNSTVREHEYALQAYLSHKLAVGDPSVWPIFGNYTDFLVEVPLSRAQRKAVDLLCNYGSCTPYYHLLVEIKNRIVREQDFLQLLEYANIFSETRGVRRSDIGGMLIGASFAEEVISLARHYNRIRTGSRLRLVRCDFGQHQHGKPKFVHVL
ncbi:MAG: hypothetical protein RMJ19_09675 [Gemmatales bacterium]|nr:hypothetical protein [Gemmatales bacterium]MDW8175928.1 hypothetical protein [Gemmatales bacterium]